MLIELICNFVATEHGKQQQIYFPFVSRLAAGNVSMQSLQFFCCLFKILIFIQHLKIYTLAQPQQTFSNASECSTASIVLLLVIPYAALGPVCSTRLAKVDWIGVVWVVVIRQNARHAALVEILTCQQQQQHNDIFKLAIK